MSEQPGRYQRSATGMIGAMLVLLALIAAFVVLREANRTEPANPVRSVDYQETLDYARDQSDLPLLAPESLPEGWRATSAEFVPSPSERWHLGVLTDEDEYVGLEQSRSSVDEMVETYVDPEAVRGRTVQVDGTPWRTWTDAEGDTALTRVWDDVTTLVVGSPDLDVLVDYVESLR